MNRSRIENLLDMAKEAKEKNGGTYGTIVDFLEDLLEEGLISQPRRCFSNHEKLIDLPGVTYRSYLEALCGQGGSEKPITKQQWDMICDLGIGAFYMHYTSTHETRIENLIKALDKEKKK